MLWQLKWGHSKTMRKLYAARHRRGDEPPPPSLSVYYKGYWDAWQAVSTERPYAGMAGVPLPIPISAIEAYGHRRHYDRAALETLVAVLRAVDSTYLQHWHAKNKKDPPPLPNAGNKKGRP